MYLVVPDILGTLQDEVAGYIADGPKSSNQAPPNTASYRVQ